MLFLSLIGKMKYDFDMVISVKEKDSSSLEQRDAEQPIRDSLAKQLHVVFEEPPEEVGTLRLDAFARGEEPILVEIFAHVGKSKSGQKRKISRDMTKLLLAEKKVGRKCRKIIAVIDPEAIIYSESGWDGEFAETFGIEFFVVKVPRQMQQETLQVQDRQRR